MADELADIEARRKRFPHVVAVILSLVALWGSIVAYLQTDASNQEAREARNAEALTVERMTALGEATARIAYDLSVSVDHADIIHQAVAYGVAALANQDTIDEALLYRQAIEGDVLNAQAQFLIPQSVLLSDPRYVSAEGDLTGFEAYLDAQYRHAYELLAEENAAADRADEWGSKSDSYSSVMAVLAVSLFFIGLSLVPEGRSRLVFLSVGLLISMASIAWTLQILLG